MFEIVVIAMAAMLVTALIPLMLRVLSIGFTSMLAVGSFALLAWAIFFLLGRAAPPDIFSRNELIASGCLLALGIVLNVFGSGNPTTRRAALGYMIVAIAGTVAYGSFKAGYFS